MSFIHLDFVWWIVIVETWLLLTFVIFACVINMQYKYLRDNAKRWREDSEKLHRYNRGQTVGATPHPKRLGLPESRPFDANENDSHRLSGYRGYMS